MLRYKLRTLLILLAVLPPLLWIGWGKYQAWRVEQERLRLINAPMPPFSKVEVTVRETSVPQPKAPASSDLEHGEGP